MSGSKRARKRYEEQRYEPSYCPECGKKRRPPEMELCPYCHPDTDYEEDDKND